MGKVENTTRKRMAAFILMGAIIVSGVAIVYLYSMPISFEMRYTSEPNPYEFVITFDYIQDATIIVDFEDNPTLIFRYVIELYSDNTVAIVTDTVFNTERVAVGFILEGANQEHAKIRQLNITIGSRGLEGLGFDFIRNSSIFLICNNNANLTGFSFRVHGDDQTVAYIGLDESVIFSGEGLFSEIISHSLLCEIYLPDGVNGRVQWNAGTEVNAWEYQSWNEYFDRYETQDTTQPLVDIRSMVDILHLWLN